MIADAAAAATAQMIADDAAAAAQKIADDAAVAATAQKIADDAAAAAQKIADDAIKVQLPLTPSNFIAHFINCTITYIFIFKFSGSQRCGEM